MLVEILVALFFVLLFGFAIWALFGLLLLPVLGKHTVSLYFARGDGGDVERRVLAYRWFQEGKDRGGRLVVVDCGLTQQGLSLTQKLRENYLWLDYCPHQILPDYIELLQQLLENEEKV